MTGSADVTAAARRNWAEGALSFDESRRRIAEASQWLSGHATLKGEVSVMIAPGVPAGATSGLAPGQLSKEALIEQAKRGFARGDSLKDLLLQFKSSGYKRPDLYQMLLIAKDAL